MPLEAVALGEEGHGWRDTDTEQKGGGGRHGQAGVGAGFRLSRIFQRLSGLPHTVGPDGTGVLWRGVIGVAHHRSRWLAAGVGLEARGLAIELRGSSGGRGRGGDKLGHGSGHVGLRRSAREEDRGRGLLEIGEACGT